MSCSFKLASFTHYPMVDSKLMIVLTIVSLMHLFSPKCSWNSCTNGKAKDMNMGYPYQVEYKLHYYCGLTLWIYSKRADLSI